MFCVIIISDPHTYSIEQHLKSLTPNNIVATYPIGASNQT